jgi:hypothetical protein
MTDADDRARSLIEDAAAAFEAGVDFLTELQRRFLTQVGAAEPVQSILGRRGGVPDQDHTAERDVLFIAGVPPEVLQRFRVAAGARGMEAAEYLTRLVDLHDAMRRLVDEGHDQNVAVVLRQLGLNTVTA